MKTVWKYRLLFRKRQEIRMPAGARVLDVQVQSQVPCLWAEVETDNAETRRIFELVRTGQPVPVGGHVATFQSDGDVWHVYEVTQP